MLNGFEMHDSSTQSLLFENQDLFDPSISISNLTISHKSMLLFVNEEGVFKVKNL